MFRELLFTSAAAVIAGAGGYLWGQATAPVQVQEVERIVYRQGETQTVWKDRIVVVEKEQKPDGTVKETTTVTEKDKAKTETVVETAKDTSTTPVVAQRPSSQYSLGVAVRPLDGTPSVTAGYRLLGPVWAEGSVSRKREVTVGLRLEF